MIIGSIGSKRSEAPKREVWILHKGGTFFQMLHSHRIICDSLN